MTESSPAEPTAPVPAAPPEFDLLDLDADRVRRAAQREAQNISNEPKPIILGGGPVAYLPVEVPVDVFAPLREIDGDITLVVRQAMEGAKRGAAGNQATTDLVIDLLASNPQLPVMALDIIRQVSANLIGEDGLTALLAQKPSGQDIAALVKGVFRFYGLTLGEALRSSVSSTGEQGTGEAAGETSNTTSNTTSGSTSEVSTDAPETPVSSEPVAS